MNSQPGAVGGLYDIAVGVTDAVAAIAYWQRFGFRVGEHGKLSAIAAKALYRVDSALTAVRLFHGTADHGLIRLMIWEKPSGPGLGLAPLRSRARAGSRR